MAWKDESGEVTWQRRKREMIPHRRLNVSKSWSIQKLREYQYGGNEGKGQITEGFLDCAREIECCLFPLGELFYGFKKGKIMNVIIYKNNYCGHSCLEKT